MSLIFLGEINTNGMSSLVTPDIKKDGFTINVSYIGNGNIEEYPDQGCLKIISRNSDSCIRVKVQHIPINTRLIILYTWTAENTYFDRVRNYFVEGYGSLSGGSLYYSPSMQQISTMSGNTKYLTYTEYVPFFDINKSQVAVADNDFIKLVDETPSDMTKTDSYPAGYGPATVYGGRTSPAFINYIMPYFDLSKDVPFYIYKIEVYLDNSPLNWIDNSSLRIFENSQTLLSRSSLYLSGELIENTENQITQFTNQGNLLISNDFIESIFAIAYKNHFEAYELIEYGVNKRQGELEKFSSPIMAENNNDLITEGEVVYSNEATISKVKWDNFLNKSSDARKNITSINYTTFDNLPNDKYRLDDETTSRKIYCWVNNNQIYYCSDATIMYLPSSADEMFYNFQSLTSLDLSNFNTSKVTNMSYMFYNCYALTSLDLSNFNTSNVTNMSYMFKNCSHLTSLNVSSFDTSNVIYMDNMFGSCNRLTSLDLSNFNTSKVTNMSGMFDNCYTLTSLDLSNFNTSSVTNMKQMFCLCSHLTSLNISSFNTSNVTNMSGMFNSCQSLTSLNVSSFNTSKVTNMGDMFRNCQLLTSLNVSNFNTSNVTIMETMFYSCIALTSLNLSNFDTSKVTNMKQMFCLCSHLTSLNVSNFNTSNVTNMGAMFSDCQLLTSLNVSSFNTGNVTDMSNMFNYCMCLVTIYVNSSKWTVSQVTNHTNMFQSCNQIRGGNGTTYNASYTNKTYARIDTASAPGYLTAG